MKDDCPVCGCRGMRPFLEISCIPITCNRLWDSKEAAVQAPSGEICLAFCQRCSHIYNLDFNPALVSYDPAYENSLFYSPRFRVYAQELAEYLLDAYGLRQKQIIEIGSGKGEFLRLLCEMGANNGVGFDPSYQAGKEPVGRGSIRFVPEYFSHRHIDHKADLICCRHVLEHLQAPAELLSMTRQIRAPVFVEVPNVLYTLRDLGIWDLIYEHPSYFSPHSLSTLFQLCGYRVARVEQKYGGQFLTIEAYPADDQINPPDGGSLEELSLLVDSFAEVYHHKVSLWTQKLSQLAAANRKVVVWGGGSKGITFLNIFWDQHSVKYLVDLNPHKQGKYAPGTGQKIVPPEFLCEYRPDVIIVMNALYEAEIRLQMESLGIDAVVLVA